jgi:TPR repeat protein
MGDNAIQIYSEGYYYYTGTNDYPLNYNKAFECFSRAAELGESNAMNYLGIMYENGRTVEKNFRMAFEWYYKAYQANPNDPYAANNLGRFYYNGIATERNIDKAYQCFKKAVELGRQKQHTVYYQCCYLTGCILLNNYKKYDEAYWYMCEAAFKGNIAEAYHNLGFLTEKGVAPINDPGTDINAARDGLAIQLYTKAAELGYVQAMDNISIIYARNNMVDDAYLWASRAANKGYEPARKRMKLLKMRKSGSIFDLF